MSALLMLLAGLIIGVVGLFAKDDVLAIISAMWLVGSCIVKAIENNRE